MIPSQKFQIAKIVKMIENLRKMQNHWEMQKSSHFMFIVIGIDKKKKVQKSPLKSNFRSYMIHDL